MRGNRIIALAAIAVLVLAFVPALADDSDGVAVINTDDVSWDFDNSHGGYITFSVNNLGGSFRMDVYVYENYNSRTGTGTLVGSLEDVLVSTSGATVTVEMPSFTSVGTHNLTVVCEPSSNFENENNTFNLTVEVTKSLLSNWVTYAVIIVVIIIIAIFAYLKIRDSPKKKTEMTFEQLEEERKAEMAAKSERKKAKSSGPSTERQRYLAEKRKKE